MSSQKIKIEGELLEKAKQCAEASGYASVESSCCTPSRRK